MKASTVERVIGTLRRECLDHVMVFNEASLHRHVQSFLAYDHESSRWAASITATNGVPSEIAILTAGPTPLDRGSDVGTTFRVSHRVRLFLPAPRSKSGQASR